MTTFNGIIFFIAVLIFSIVIHEVSHGVVANWLGDPTAKNAGRLTLNPLKHLDPIGTVILPIAMILLTGQGIGWAKPVPVNPYNFRDQKYGSLKVAAAGPGSNFLIALIFGLIIRYLPPAYALPQSFYEALSFIVFINLLLAVFNLVPLSPLDGSHILFSVLPASMDGVKLFLGRYGFFIMLFLIFLFPPFFVYLSYLIDLIFSFIVGFPPTKIF